jgi:hypothetical protein
MEADDFHPDGLPGQNPYAHEESAHEANIWAEGYVAALRDISALKEAAVKRATSTVSCPHGFVNRSLCYRCFHSG